jgi:hypothetical protein
LRWLQGFAVRLVRHLAEEASEALLYMEEVRTRREVDGVGQRDGGIDGVLLLWPTPQVSALNVRLSRSETGLVGKTRS